MLPAENLLAPRHGCGRRYLCHPSSSDLLIAMQPALGARVVGTTGATRRVVGRLPLAASWTEADRRSREAPQRVVTRVRRCASGQRSTTPAQRVAAARRHDAIPPSNLRRTRQICCTLRVHLNGRPAFQAPEISARRPVRGSDRPFNGEYAYARWSVDLSYALIGAGSPYHLYRGSSRAMTSALHDAGIGVDGG